MDSPVEPRRIRRLPAQLANQIAAGEVVERPASVVKELLENSLDSGADRIDVEVKGGGVALIRLRDNGGGIHADDLPLSVSAHATSKIASAGELERVRSLGFRGEALASIAAIARLAITSRPTGASSAARLACDGGRVYAPEPAAHGPGTTVEVRDLFFNTPARRKFLRTERTEFGHIEETVRRLALARPDVALRLAHNGRDVLNLASVEGGGSRRLSLLYGKRFAASAVGLDFEAAGMRLRGWIAPAEEARSQADRQYFYVNGRAVRDRVVTHAVRQAYADRLYPGRHPAFALFLDLDPGAVDVNVHPTKHEVRFREARLVHDFIVRSLRNALGEVQAPSPAAIGDAGVPGGSVADATAFYNASRLPGDVAGARMEDGLHGTPLRRIGASYLVASAGDGLLLVDVAAARYRIAVRRLASEVAGEGVVARPLLVPSPLQVSPAEAAALERVGETLAAWGMEFGRLGEREVVLRRLPALLDAPDADKLVRNVAACAAAAAPGIPTADALLHAIAGSESAEPAHGDGDAGLLRLLDRWLGDPGPPHAVRLDAAMADRLFAEAGDA